jgi:hypothetical protein
MQLGHAPNIHRILLINHLRYAEQIGKRLRLKNFSVSIHEAYHRAVLDPRRGDSTRQRRRSHQVAGVEARIAAG